MPKFSEISKSEQIVYIKDEFIKIIEEVIADPSKIKAELPEDKFNVAMEFLPQLKVEGCACGQCIYIEKLEGRIPSELQCLIEIAHKRCDAKVY